MNLLFLFIVQVQWEYKVSASPLKLKSGDALYADVDACLLFTWFFLPGPKNSTATTVQRLLCFEDAHNYQSARYVLEKICTSFFPPFFRCLSFISMIVTAKKSKIIVLEPDFLYLDENISTTTMIHAYSSHDWSEWEVALRFEVLII
jgi:hypothetical protein